MATVNLGSQALGIRPCETLVQPFFSQQMAQDCADLGDVALHLDAEGVRCKSCKDPTWTAISMLLTGWLQEQCEEARKAGKQMADAVVNEEDALVARQRALKRQVSLGATSPGEDALRAKRQRTDGVSLAMEGNEEKKEENEEDPDEEESEEEEQEDRTRR